MLRQNRILTCAVSFVLCLTLIVNCNTFRKDTYAFLPAIAIPVGAAVIEVSAEAIVAIFAVIYGGKIIADSYEAQQDLVTKGLKYDATTYGIDHTKGILSDAGFDVVDSADGTTTTVGVPSGKKVTWIFDGDGKGTCLESGAEIDLTEHTEPTGGDGGGSGDDGGGDNGGDDNNKTPLGKRIMAGFLAVGSGIGSLGSSFYDFLNNSEDVEYIPAVSSYTDSLSNIKSDLNSLYVARAKELFNKDITVSFCSANNFTGWEYYDLYYGGPYVDGSNKWYAAYVLGYNRSDNSCRLYTGGYREGTSDISYWKLYARGAQTRPDIFDISYSITTGNGYTVKLSQLKLVKHYVNTDVLTDQSANIGVTTDLESQLKVGDTVYNISEGDNIYNNQQYVTQQISDKTDSDGNVIVTCPHVNSETGAITYPQYITYEGDSIVYGDTITYVNPDDIDVKEDVALDDEDVENANIFKLLYNYFGSFWRKLRQVLRDFFIPDLSEFYNSFDTLKDKFPIIDQAEALCDKLINYNFDSSGPPAFLIKYKTAAFDYETSEQSMVDFSGINSFVSILHGIILFIAYFGFAKKIVGKITKVFQP